MLGDPTLFIRADEAEGAWSILEPFMHAWSEKGGFDLPGGNLGTRRGRGAPRARRTTVVAAPVIGESRRFAGW